MKMIRDKSIFLHTTTYESLGDKGDLLIRLLEKIFDEFVNAFNIKLSIVYETNNYYYRHFDYNAAGIKKLYAALKKGQVLNLAIKDFYENADNYEDEFPELLDDYEEPPRYMIPDISIGLSCSDVDPNIAFYRTILKPINTFSFALSERLFNYSIPEQIQIKFKNLFKTIVKEMNSVTGFISYETSAAGPKGSITHYENYYLLNPDQLPGYTEHLRGYFWFNLLTTDHIRKLGGPEFIQKNAPCAYMETIEINGETGLLLQLSADINDYTDVQLRELRTFLLPLLPLPDNDAKEDSKVFYSSIPDLTHRLVEE